MDREREGLLMTPGPTALPPEVRTALGRPLLNPDVESEFAEYYRSILEKLAAVYRTDDDVLVLGGEGILGLEASVASLVGPDDPVLCLSNGVYGAGFADFVETHGGSPEVHSVSPRSGFDVEAVKSRLESREFDVATMVHCETPTGLLNDLDEILATLQDAGVITVVDAVSSLGGAPVPVADVDVCVCASQKCLSSPPGLTTLSVSDRAWQRIGTTDQDTFYTSLAPWRDVDLEGGELLPYTHLISNLYALEASLDRLLEEGLEAVHERHRRVATRCRELGRDAGLEVFPDTTDRCSPTVTAFEVDGRAAEVQRRLEAEHDVVVATGIGDRADDILRVGHMGYNADPERVDRTMDALGAVTTDA